MSKSLEQETRFFPQNLVSKVWAVVRKDLALERRSRDMLTSMLVFGLIVILVYSFSFDLRIERVLEVAPGTLWVAIAFAGMLGLARSFVLERDQACLDGLLLCPVDRTVIYFGKALGNLLFISAVEVVLLPLYIALFNLPFRLLLLPVVFLGTLGFSVVGTLVSAMAVHARSREVMLPILLFPLVIPVLIAAVRLTAGILDRQPWAEMQLWLNLLIGFDIGFLVLASLVFEYVVEE